MASEEVGKKAQRAETPVGLNRLEVLRGLRLATWEGSYSTLFGSLTTGAFVTGFALWLGANSFDMGLLAAVPLLAGLVQIVSSYTGERRETRKWFTASYSVTARTLWLPILLVPLLLPRPTALIAFLLLYALSWALLNVPAPAWISWMSDLVPPDHRGRYFARRNTIMGIVGMVAGIPAAWFLDLATKHHHWEPLGFGTLFGVAVVCGLLSFVTLLRQPEPPRSLPPGAAEGGEQPGGWRRVLAYYHAPFADANFRRLMLFNIAIGAGQNFAAPFFTVYSLQVLKLDYIWLQVLATITSVFSLATMPLCGYLADKFGNRPLLAIGVAGVFTVPLVWMLTSPLHPALTALLLVEINVASGIFWSMVGLTQFNLLIGSSPPDRTSIYAATMAGVTGLTSGISPLVGSVTMAALAQWQAHLPGLTLTNYHITFLIAALLRLAGLPLLRSVTDAGARSTREVLQQLGRANPRDWRNIRQMQRAGDAETRLRATEALGGSRTRLALDELQTALADPSLAVREEAAHALGEIGDRQAVEALLAALEDPAAGLTAVAAQALGRIGDRSANSALTARLLSPEGTLSRRDRLAVAQALGDLGGVDAVDALVTALHRAEDEETAEVIVDALGRIGAARATVPLLQLLERSGGPVGLRQALVRALGEIGDRSALDTLRRALAEADKDDLMLPSLAEALARLRDVAAIPALLERMAHLASPVARKQTAHAIGRLLGQEVRVYSLLGQEEMARDEAVSRLIQECRRQMRACPGAAEAAQAALDKYTTGDYTACLRALQAAGSQVSPADAETPERLARHDLLNRTAAQPDPPIETVILALCALRGLL